MPAEKTRALDILLVESRAGYTDEIRDALADTMPQEKLHVVDSGEEALDFLHQRGEHKDAPFPHVVVLDLDVPNRNGWAVFTGIKADKRLEQIPVVIRTTSGEESELLKKYKLGDHFIVKTADGADFLEMLHSIGALQPAPCQYRQIVTGHGYHSSL